MKLESKLLVYLITNTYKTYYECASLMRSQVYVQTGMMAVLCKNMKEMLRQIIDVKGTSFELIREGSGIWCGYSNFV